MDADRWRRVEELYHAATALPPAERSRFLADRCPADAALRAEVESLLAYGGSGFIEAPALHVAARLLAEDGTALDAPLSGATLGHFEVRGKLGEGGMGVVYEALDTRLGRSVALKLLPSYLLSSREARERFEHEARAASALNHPNICTIHSVQDVDGRLFIEMERLEGETLGDRLRKGPLDLDEIVPLALQVLDGLDAAHGRGIVHRDLKPANVFCTHRGVAKVLDFGIARRGSAPAGDRGAAYGSAGYMSPEQASGQPVDARSDLYSLGAMLRELVAGRSAPALERIISRALRESPDLRYQRASEMRADIERMQRRARGRRRLARVAAAASAVAGATALAVGYWSRDPGDVLDGAGVEIRQLTHNASGASVIGGQITPDGRHLVYADPEGLHVRATDGGATRDVPPPAGVPPDATWEIAGGWFPGGRRLAVNLIRGDGHSSVWSLDLGGAPRRLRDGARALAVSPDGRWIAFAPAASPGAVRALWVMDADAAHPRKLFAADPGTRIHAVSWSPDSRRVAYMRVVDGRWAATIETRPLDGGAPETAIRVEGPEVLQGFVWLPGRLLYSTQQPPEGTSGGTVPCSHWQAKVDAAGRSLGSRRRLAGWLPHCVAGLSLSADLRRAVYGRWALQDTIYVAGLDSSARRILSPRRLTFAEGRNIPSGWTADGQSLVFMSDSLGRGSLVRQRVDAEAPQAILDDPRLVGAARLTPAGDAVLYTAFPRLSAWTRTRRLMRVPLAGGQPQELLTGAFVEGPRCTVPPARLCAFAEHSEDGRQLVFRSVPLRRGSVTELARFDAPPGDYRWALSPDGRVIALLEAGTPRVHLLSLAGAPPRAFDVAGAGTLGYVSWTSDGARLIVPAIDARGATLLSVDLEGRSAVLWHQPRALDISGIPSRDGRRIAIWVRRPHLDLWLAAAP